MDPAQTTRMSRALKAVSDENRIRILEVLVRGEHCVSDLVHELSIDQPKVSHHLAILRSAGVIKSRRDGRHINYSVRGSLHRREATPQGPVDVFDLGDLSVAFRFGEVTGATPAIASVQAVNGSEPVEPRRQPAAALEEGHASNHLL